MSRDFCFWFFRESVSPQPQSIPLGPFRIFSKIRRRYDGPGERSPNFETFKKPKNRFQGINSARLWSLVGRYDNPIPTRFLAPIDCFKIPAQDVTHCFFPTNFSSYPFLFFMYSQKRLNARQTKTTAIEETEKISVLLEIFTLSRD